MSHDSHGDGHDAHAPATPEVSHPLLWTAGLGVACLGLVVWFSYWFGSGTETARTVAPLKLATAGPVEPDHAKLIADRSDAVLDKGAKIYAQNCASCHGADGKPALPNARNFVKDAMKSDKGGGPYAFYLVLKDGLGAAMPAFKSLPAEDKYAVTHFVREKFMRGVNPAFAEADKPGVTIPAPGAAAGGKSAGAPAKPAPIESLLSGLAARQGETVAHRLATVVAAAEGHGSGPALRSLAEAKPACAVLLIEAASTGNRPAFDALIADVDGRGTTTPALRAMDDAGRTTLFTVLRKATTAQGGH
jgi:mono/diheme cytochrome c family protein